MSELDLLADCLKDATKERDELAAALDQYRTDLGEADKRSCDRLKRIEQLETAIWKYWSDHALVANSDLQLLALEMQKQLTAGISEPETDFRKARGVLSVEDQDP